MAHYYERVKRTEARFRAAGDTREYRSWIRSQGFEPGSHGRSERVDDYGSDVYRTQSANIDIRHNDNLTPSRWRQDQFRNKNSCRNWQESDSVPGWGVTEGRFADILQEVLRGDFVVK